MGTEYPKLDEKITDFISPQRMFFTASAVKSLRINISPRSSDEYTQLIETYFDENPPMGIRQLVRLRFDLVKTSCGYGVPFFAYEGERDALTRWAEHKGREGVEASWEKDNIVSMDGLPTGIFDEN